MSLYLRQLPLGPMENFVYLVGDPTVKKCWVVDPAWDLEAIEAAAVADGYELAGALITHGHFDHVNAVAPLLKRLDLPVYIHPHELEFLDAGAPRGLFLDLPRGQAKPSQTGEKLTLGSTELTFLHTPGHTPGSQCFLVNGRLLSGDTLFLGTCGRCDLPGSDPAKLFESLNNVIGRLPADTVLYPGHNYSDRGTHAPLSEERKKNRFLSAHTLPDFLKLIGY